MGFKLSTRDRAQIAGVHPDLVRVIERAASESDIKFTVLEGLRTKTRQKELLAAGSSWTMNSRHIKAANGYGHAVDLAPLENGKPSWSWPLYHQLAPIIKRAAADEGVPIVWGGDWKRVKGRSEPDGPHWELPWSRYPGTVQTASLGGAVYGDYDVGDTDATPADYPYEMDNREERLRARSHIRWSLRGIFASAGATIAGLWQDQGSVVIVCVALIAALCIVIFREEIRAGIRERLS